MPPSQRICCRCSAASLRALIKDQPTLAGRRGRAACGRSRRSETPPHTAAWYGNADGADADLERRQYAPCDVRVCHKGLLSWRSLLGRPMRWGGHTPPVTGLRDWRARAIPFRAVPPAPEVRRTARIILNGEPRALANRANAKTKGLAAPCFKRTGRIVIGRNQYTTKIEDRHISARAKALGFATVRANERGADGRLRGSLLACSFRDDLPLKLVTYGSPERCHGAGAFCWFHGVVLDCPLATSFCVRAPAPSAEWLAFRPGEPDVGGRCGHPFFR